MTHVLPSRTNRPRQSLVTAVLPLLLATAALVPCSPAEAGTGRAAGRTTGPVGVWPLQPRPEVVDRFDAPDTRWGPGHRGVDLRGSVGQAVHAAEAGTVTFAGRIAGRGVVVVDHGSTRTTYEPVDATVSAGDAVVTGAVVGRLTLAGSHCFPAACLHWGLIEGAATYRDPLTLVGGGPVRLLPLTGPLPAAPGLLDTWLMGLAGSSAQRPGTDSPTKAPRGPDTWLTDTAGSSALITVGPSRALLSTVPAAGSAAAFRGPLP